MPQLHTLVSQPMHPCRLLTKSPTHYPITAQLLSGGLGSIASNITQTTHALLHLGLRMHPPRQPKLGLTRFHYADIHEQSALPRIGLKYLPLLFPKLTHLDMCISVTQSRRDLYELQDFIMKAKNLTHLRLCFERSYTSFFEIGPSFESGSHIVLSHPGSHLPKLRYLYITDTQIAYHNLLRFVKRHASTLRFLRVEENMPPEIIETFAGMMMSHKLDLDDLVVLPSNPDECFPVIPFDDDFKNGEILRNGTAEAYAATNDLACITGMEPRYDINSWRTAAIVDSRYPFSLLGCVDPGDIKFLDAENGDWRDPSGYTFPIEDDENIDQDPEQDVAEAREHASHMKRLRESPWWVFESLFNGQPLPFHRTDAQRIAMQNNVGDLPVCPTEVWRFQHRNGEVAFANDPLEYWEDWEGSQAGDSAIPTPYGLDGGNVHLFRMELLIGQIPTQHLFNPMQAPEAEQTEMPEAGL
ncbi:uncharacterized protein F4807DRAFT_168411 [Annulohypoxylon truncatum]|uniref:uncharacterized protein n=1 Tax=Annulohypoxylon truncatum TaxID=327061 RepID=UPI0020078C10|nr:uncharacterized protein F4807DRAFT_168411 [Annulohypoxylon truncatum]KAI1207855.1 hypothetical protein F4807DRAFT_168411 [Annulohypoxylon truncatum]